MATFLGLLFAIALLVIGGVVAGGTGVVVAFAIVIGMGVLAYIVEAITRAANRG